MLDFEFKKLITDNESNLRSLLESAYTAGYNRRLTEEKLIINNPIVYIQRIKWMKYNYGATQESDFQNSHAVGHLLTYEKAKAIPNYILPSKKDIEWLYKYSQPIMRYNRGYEKGFNHRACFRNEDGQEISFYHQGRLAKGEFQKTDFTHSCQIWLSDEVSEDKALSVIFPMKIIEDDVNLIGDLEGELLPPIFVEVPKDYTLYAHLIYNNAVDNCVIYL